MELRSDLWIRQLKLSLFLVFAGTLNGLASSAPQIGVLTCDVSQGISQSIICDFRRPGEPAEAYSGIVEKVDPAINADEDGHLVWAVVAKGPHVEPGALSGEYAAAKAGLLVGGHAKALTLRPLDIDDGAGVNLASRIMKISLVASN